MLRAIRLERAGETAAAPFDFVTLTHDERHLRRKLLVLSGGTEVMVDLPQAVALADGDVLLLEDGRAAGIRAAQEDLYAVTAPSADKLVELAWHLGNRHLPAQLASDRILIARDRVIADMLLGLGAHLEEIRSPFSPARGAYHETGHGHSHGHSHDHAHG